MSRQGRCARHNAGTTKAIIDGVITEIPAFVKLCLHKPGLGPVTQGFGVLDPWGSIHRGVDLWIHESGPVLASAKGIIISLERCAAPNYVPVPLTPTYNVDLEHGHGGNYVEIDHGMFKDRIRQAWRITSLYFHLADVGVVLGQLVEPGNVIGRCGTTGWSSGFHVHWELRRDGVPFDPTDYIV